MTTPMQFSKFRWPVYDVTLELESGGRQMTGSFEAADRQEAGRKAEEANPGWVVVNISPAKVGGKIK